MVDSEDPKEQYFDSVCDFIRKSAKAETEREAAYRQEVIDNLLYDLTKAKYEAERDDRASDAELDKDDDSCSGCEDCNEDWNDGSSNKPEDKDDDDTK